MRTDIDTFHPILTARCPTLGTDTNNLRLANLLLQCGAGTTNAFSQLHRLAAPGLRRYASRLTSQQDIIDDIVQDSMIAIWRQAASYAPQLAGPMTWMHAIVRHKTFDYFRAQRVRQSADTHFVTDRMHDEVTTGSPCSLIEMRQRSDEIARCLDQLIDAQRLAIELAYMQDLTHEEVAQTMQRPLGTVKTWIRRGVLDLRRQMSRPQAMGVRSPCSQGAASTRNPSRLAHVRLHQPQVCC